MTIELPIWSLLIVVVLGNLVWATLVRTFPNVLGQRILKGVQHNYDKKLATLRGQISAENEKGLAILKGQMEATSSDIRSSIDFLTATYADRKSKEIDAVESLWKSLQAIEREFASLRYYEWCILPEEFDNCVKGRDLDDPSKRMLKRLSEYHHTVVARKHSKAYPWGSEILFVSTRLWNLCHTILRIHARFGFLIHRSLEEKEYKDWRHDDVMLKDILSGFDSGRITQAKRQRCGGLNEIIQWLTAEFIHEAKKSVHDPDEVVQTVTDIARGLNSSVRDAPSGPLAKYD